MADDGKTLDDVAFDAKMDLSEAVDDWVSDFRGDTGDLEGFPTIDAIEGSLVELESKTRKILLMMASDALSSIDEREMVDAKKGS